MRNEEWLERKPFNGFTRQCCPKVLGESDLVSELHDVPIADFLLTL
jgi:hypothetical protein